MTDDIPTRCCDDPTLLSLPGIDIILLLLYILHKYGIIPFLRCRVPSTEYPLFALLSTVLYPFSARCRVPSVPPFCVTGCPPSCCSECPFCCAECRVPLFSVAEYGNPFRRCGGPHLLCGVPLLPCRVPSAECRVPSTPFFALLSTPLWRCRPSAPPFALVTEYPLFFCVSYREKTQHFSLPNMPFEAPSHPFQGVEPSRYPLLYQRSPLSTLPAAVVSR